MDTLTIVARIVKDVTGLDEVDYDAPFFEMELDSIQMMEVIGKVQIEVEIKISATALFEYTTIRTFSEYLSNAS